MEWFYGGGRGTEGPARAAGVAASAEDLREGEELSEGLRTSWTRAGRVREPARGGERGGGCTVLRGSEDQIRHLQAWS